MPLPHIDEHAVVVAAEPDRVWRALMDGLPRGPFSSRGAELFATLLGCRERMATGTLDQVGATLVGFRVVRSEPPSELALAGEHRFSRYALTFSIEDLGAGRGSRLRARTDAAFPGLRGGAYRALVIGSGGHVRAVRGMLARISRRAAPPAPGRA